MIPAPAGWAGRIAARLRGHALEAGALTGILTLAAVLRFINLPLRGGWDADQGVEMMALRNALQSGTLPAFGPVSSLGNFHHGALSRDIELPAAWLGNGDPTWVAAETALLSLIVVVAAWWIARSIAGPAAGLSAGLLAAVSAGQITFATLIWSPTPVEPGAALAYLGAWSAVSRLSARWWTIAAAGAALAAQSHLAAAVIVVPLIGVWVADLVRGPSGRRRSVVAWGAAGAALFVATWLPQLASELGHDFADTRGVLAYFAGPSAGSGYDPLARLFFALIRILAWPLTGWPLIQLPPALALALVTMMGLVVGLGWRLWATRRLTLTRKGVGVGADATAVGDTAAGGRAASSERSLPASSTAPLPGSLPASSTAPLPGSLPASSTAPLPNERLGARFVAAGLASLVLVLGLGLHSVSEVQALPTEQYHIVADPLVFVAAGIVLGALWRAVAPRQARVARRCTVLALLAVLTAWNAAHWPPLVSPDGGWPAAEAAATRVERAATGSTVALVPLFEPKGTDAYGYPLLRDGVSLVSPQDAGIVVLLCDSYWMDGCGGAAESDWVARNAAGSGLVLVDSFAAAPDRLLSVYRRAP